MANNNVIINNNEIFEAGAYFETGENMIDIVKNNILNDYKIGGVKSLQISIFATDIYNFYNKKAKNSQNGDLVEINDIIVLVDKDKNYIYKNQSGNPIYWKVISRTFDYQGQPLVILGLQEVK